MTRGRGQMEHNLNAPIHTNTIAYLVHYRVSYFLPLIFKHMSYFEDLEKNREKKIEEQRKITTPSSVGDSALKALAVFVITLTVSYIFFKQYIFIILLAFCILYLLEFYELTWIFIIIIPLTSWVFKNWEKTVATFKEMYPSIILILVIILLFKLYVDTKD